MRKRIILIRAISLVLCIIFVFSISFASAETSALGYRRPGSEEIIRDILKTNLNNAHPRLMINSASIGEIKNAINDDDNMLGFYNNCLDTADKMLDLEVLSYDEGNTSLTGGTGRKIISAVQTLGMAWLLTKNGIYAEKVWKILEGMCSFPTWCSSQQLDLGPNGVAAAIGFDWCYDYFSAQQKETILDSISKKVLMVGKKWYDDNEAWTRSLTNWNGVINAGIALCALAVADEASQGEIAGACLSNSLDSVALLLKHFDPNGAWDEGLTYWEFTLEYLVYYLASFESACGSDYGYFENSKGFCASIYFPQYICGPCGRFNYGDAGMETTAPRPEVLYFAKRLSDASIAAIRLKYVLPRGWGGVNELMWYDKSLSEGEDPILKNNIRLVGSSIEIPILRSGWNKKDRFLAVRGGDVSVNHGHHDSGGFVFDADGVRWAVELGGENYYSDYFSSGRYEYYRTRLEGHNTLVVNPGYEDNINRDATVPTDVFNGSDFSYITADLSKVHPDAISIKRGFMLYDNFQYALVQDEITLKENGEIYWFMHTGADIIINGDTAVLSADGKYLKAKIISPSGATFEKMTATPLSGSPQKQQSENSGISKLAIHLDDVKESIISVALMPLGEDRYADKESPKLLPISMWKNRDLFSPRLLSLEVNRNKTEFDANNSADIHVENGKTPEYITRAIGCYRLIKPLEIPGTAYVYVGKTKADKNASVYKVNLRGEPLNIVPVYGEGAERLCDGDESTYNVVKDERYIFDLGKETEINGVGIQAQSMIGGEFNLNISSDGKNWSRIYYAGILDAGKMNFFDGGKRTARYVRLSVKADEGCISEISIY